DGEAAAHEGVDVVHLGPVEVLGREGVDVHPEAGHLGYLIGLAGWVLVETHAVGETGAAARAHEDAQADVEGGLLPADQLLELAHGGVADGDHGAGNLCISSWERQVSHPRFRFYDTLPPAPPHLRDPAATPWAATSSAPRARDRRSCCSRSAPRSRGGP